jgi:hypothetical protein
MEEEDRRRVVILYCAVLCYNVLFCRAQHEILGPCPWARSLCVSHTRRGHTVYLRTRA